MPSKKRNNNGKIHLWSVERYLDLRDGTFVTLGGLEKDTSKFVRLPKHVCFDDLKVEFTERKVTFKFRTTMGTPAVFEHYLTQAQILERMKYALEE